MSEDTPSTERETTDDRTDESAPTDDRTDDHVRDLADGAGCVEIWERLSEDREE